MLQSGFGRGRWRWRVAAFLGVCALVLAAGPVAADGPPGPPPYPKIVLDSSDAPAAVWACYRGDDAVWYGHGWTLEPLVRGPFFAPVVLWLEGTNQPVVPVRFDTSGYPFGWSTADGGPFAEGTGGDVTNGRPVGYGSTPTGTTDEVRCAIYKWGYEEFGTYRITAALQKMMGWDEEYGEWGVPPSMIGRRLAFDNEGSLSFSLPASQFPTTATVKAPTLATPDYASYGKRSLPPLRCTAGSTVKYSGAAWTLAPLTRGYQWSPMAFWLDGDRIVAPRWFTSTTTGSWKTTSGTPALQGVLDAEQRARPSGFGARPAKATSGVHCTWSGPHSATRVATKALVTQLGLPTSVRGRTVELTGHATVHAYTPTWMWPPAS
jgi:hypothetical protein